MYILNEYGSEYFYKVMSACVENKILTHKYGKEKARRLAPTGFKR